MGIIESNGSFDSYTDGITLNCIVWLTIKGHPEREAKGKSY